MFSIGNLVTLKSNPEVKMTVYSEVNELYNCVDCIYINKNQKVEKNSFPVDCIQLYEDDLKEATLQKIPLLYCKEKDCYSFFEYASIFGQNVNPNTPSDETTTKNARFVYEFKKNYPTNKQEVFNLITMVKHYLGGEQIVCVPGHTLALNSLQKVFGVTIERTVEIEERKYNHKKGLCDGYEDSYKIDYTKLSPKLILVDDILTAGATMEHFRKLLTDKGYDVTCVAIGIDHKLNFEVVNHFWLFK